MDWDLLMLVCLFQNNYFTINQESKMDFVLRFSSFATYLYFNFTWICIMRHPVHAGEIERVMQTNQSLFSPLWFKACRITKCAINKGTKGSALIQAHYFPVMCWEPFNLDLQGLSTVAQHLAHFVALEAAEQMAYCSHFHKKWISQHLDLKDGWCYYYAAYLA